ncbi:hypothetical protein B7494_g5586 [Chlorociboria aeruginascens]|nr:hypothetical protein B7494_g5586 [Chlorociboria aeruginascens]
MAAFKFPTTVSEHEIYQSQYDVKKAAQHKRVESVRYALTTLTLLSGIAIVATSADGLSVYNKTSLAPDFYLSLWPTNLDLRPTIAQIVCGSIIILSSSLSLIVGKIAFIKHLTLLNTALSFLAPSISFIAALISMSFYYGVNRSATFFTLQSWGCQWSDVTMNTQPYWHSLCSESKAALYLSVVMVPVQVLVLAAAGWSVMTQKARGADIERERKGSPALS